MSLLSSWGRVLVAHHGLTVAALATGVLIVILLRREGMPVGFSLIAGGIVCGAALVRFCTTARSTSSGR